MENQPFRTAETPPASRRGSIPGFAVVFVVVGGVLQGIGANIERYISPGVAWGGSGVLIGMACSVWFARRLRWWLLLYIPAIVILMIPLAIATETGTGAWIRSAGERFGDCRGWGDLKERFDPVTLNIQAYMDDMNTAENPDLDDARRWSDAAGEIHRQFEGLEPPPALDLYVERTTQVFRAYEEGFAAMADGDNEAGLALLDEGDRTLPTAQAEFASAKAKCEG